VSDASHTALVRNARLTYAEPESISDLVDTLAIKGVARRLERLRIRSSYYTIRVVRVIDGEKKNPERDRHPQLGR